MGKISEKNMTINHQWLRWWHQWWREVVSEIRCRPAAPDAEMPIPLSRRLANGTAEPMLDADTIVVQAGQWHS